MKFYSMLYSRTRARAASRGWTMAELARRCRVSRQALVFSLKADSLSLESRKRLATALNVPGHPMSVAGLEEPLTTRELLRVAAYYLGLVENQR